MRYARGILEMTDGKNTSVSKDTSLEFYYLNLRNKWKMQIAAQWTYWHKNQNMWSATAKMLQELRWDAFCLAKKWSAFLSSHYLKLTQVSAVFSHTKALFWHNTSNAICFIIQLQELKNNVTFIPCFIFTNIINTSFIYFYYIVCIL